MDPIAAFILGVVIVLGLLIAGGIRAHRTVGIDVPLSSAKATEAARSAFGDVLWKPTSGPGVFTMAKQALMERNRFHLSVNVQPSGSGSEVTIWMSYGLSVFNVNGATALAVIRQQRKVIRVLESASAQVTSH